jgi:hypothetical protein
LQICGWGGLNRKEILESTINKLESEGETEKAAAMAVFHLNLRRATTILSNSKTGLISYLSLFIYFIIISSYLFISYLIICSFLLKEIERI